MTALEIAETNQSKRLLRKKQSAEDFTPSWLVNEMLDKLEEYSPNTFTNKAKTYLDPACGNGNMLIEVLKRKLVHASPVEALKTIYGCDIMFDNIDECRMRLLLVVKEHIKGQKKKLTEKQYLKFRTIVKTNIVCTPLSEHPNGSLYYLSLPEDITFQEFKKIKQKQPNMFPEQQINECSNGSLSKDKLLSKRSTKVIIKKKKQNKTMFAN